MSASAPGRWSISTESTFGPLRPGRLLGSMLPWNRLPLATQDYNGESLKPGRSTRISDPSVRYSGAMARATKRDMAISEAIDGLLSPSQINRLTAERFDLPLEGFRALAPLVGTGRDLNVAAVRLAAEHGHCSARLRQVVANPADDVRGAVIYEAAAQATLEAAEELARAGDNTLPAAADTPEAEARVMVGSAFLEAADALQGHEAVEFKEMHAISRQIAIKLGGSPEPGCDVYGDEFAAWMRAAAGRLQVVDKWATNVPSEELVRSVQLASALCQRTTRHIGLSEEDYWRVVGAMAPHVGALFELLNALYGIPALGEKSWKIDREGEHDTSPEGPDATSS
jgi:hypothetical protein